MARFGTLKRNIKRNIRHWGDEGEDRPSGHRAMVAFILSVLIMLTLSGVMIPLTMNVVFRIPDLYKLYLGRTDRVKDMDIKVSSDAVANMISSFMRNGIDDFQIEGKVDAENSELFFTENDGTVMKELKLFLDNMLIIGFTTLAVFATLFYLLVKWIRPRELKKGLIGGVIIFGVSASLIALFIMLKNPALWIWEDILGAKFQPDDRLPQIFGDNFLFMGWIVVTVVSFIAILLLFSFTNRFTRRHKVF